MELSDTVLEGVEFTLKDGSKKYIKCKEPIIIKTEEENNGQ